LTSNGLRGGRLGFYFLISISGVSMPTLKILAIPDLESSSVLKIYILLSYNYELMIRIFQLENIYNLQ
jgi:hypothetical protein